MFCLECSRGMNYLVAKGIVHGDLAARNCMLDDNLHLRITDFGLSKQAKETDEENYDYIKLYNDNSLFPVRWYPVDILLALRSHEEDSITLRVGCTDVWSYGILMWEIFTKGEKPYDHIPMNTLVAEAVIDNQRLARPEACPHIVHELMLRTWMRYPKNRPTFDDVCYAIAYFMTGGGNILKCIPKVPKM